jgi:predicted amidohydrolase YtcJ
LPRLAGVTLVRYLLLGAPKVGKRATFIVLSQNLFEIPTADLSETQVLKTVFNGKEVDNK